MVPKDAVLIPSLPPPQKAESSNVGEVIEMWRFPQSALCRNASGKVTRAFSSVVSVEGRRSVVSNVFATQRSSSLLTSQNISRWNVSVVGRVFSTNTNQENEAQQQTEDETMTTTTTTTTSPEKQLPTLDQVTTPGQAQHVLCRQDKISTEEFEKLVELARPGHERDATVILYCLKHMTVYKKLIISASTADLAVLKILDCLLAEKAENDETKDDDDNKNNTPMAKRQVDAAMLVLNNFNQNTGLYFAVGPATIHKVLNVLLEGVRGGGAPPPVPPSSAKEEKKEEEEKEEEGVEKKKGFDPVVNLLHDFIRLLIYRTSFPHQKMKKRTARKYRKHSKDITGPSPEHIHVALQTAMHLVPFDVAVKRIIHPCTKAKRRILDETMELIATKKAEQRYSYTAPTTEAATAVMADETKNDDESSITISSDESSFDESIATNDERQQDVGSSPEESTQDQEETTTVTPTTEKANTEVSVTQETH